MSMTAPQTIVDPLHALVAGGFVSGTKRPIPLVATRFNVDLNHGLATVSTTRIFKNAEETSIEATITFPVPVHAVLFSLTARIAGRVLKARAQRKSQARDDYEDAIERGKTAVLHEEVLRGVHMLSVAHVPPGAEVEVSATWTMTLTNLNGRGHMRIPLTVGDIYGRSGLPDSDDLTYGGAVQTAELTVQCRDGQVILLGGRLDNGRAQVALNAPIDLEVNGWTTGDLRGRAADGREVVLRVEPTPFGDADIDVAVMIDHSGSMGEICSGENRNLTKHQALLAGLHTMGAQISQSDVIDIWEFDDTPRHVGSTGDKNRLQSLIGRLSGPAGGTEIGAALAVVTRQSRGRDVLLVTDGKSHALDVQALARTGSRFSVVLVGEDSLEANVGHLAALTGGEIFVSTGVDLAEVLDAAVRSFRTRHHPATPISGKLQHISARRAGMTLTAKWQEAEGLMEETVERRAVAALAASLALPAFDTESAARLAETEGLVTHLTSRVLVDEAGAVQEGIPATRKVALPAPRLGAMTSMAPTQIASLELELCPRRDSVLSAIHVRRNLDYNASTPIDPAVAQVDLSSLGAEIDWDLAPQQLQAGDLSTLDRDVARAIRSAAAITEVAAFARQFALDPVAMVVGLIARFESSRNRSAARLAKAIFGDIASPRLDHIAQILCLA
jgi:Vault protein inter-alpha-trypsin domain/von Willebrand factor type A domain